MSIYEMVKNSEVFFNGPYMHEARKTFKSIADAVNSACKCSYSLNESDIGILTRIQSIISNEDVKEIIDEYKESIEGDWNQPRVGYVNSYDDPENAMVEEYKDATIADSIFYQTSSGKNQLMIREISNKNEEKKFLAIYRVESRHPLQLSSAMQEFGKDGWDCRCIVAPKKNQYKVDNVLAGNNVFRNQHWGRDSYSGENRHGFMIQPKLSSEIIKRINDRNYSLYVSEEQFEKYSLEDAIKEVLRECGIQQDIQIQELTGIDVKEDDGFIKPTEKKAYEVLENLEGTLIECAMLKGTAWTGTKHMCEIYIKHLEPNIRSYEWTEITSEVPPSKELLMEIDRSIPKGNLWTDAKKQLEVRDKIIEDNWGGYSPSEIEEAIKPTECDIQEILNETLAAENENAPEEQDGPTIAD